MQSSFWRVWSPRRFLFLQPCMLSRLIFDLGSSCKWDKRGLCSGPDNLCDETISCGRSSIYVSSEEQALDQTTDQSTTTICHSHHRLDTRVTQILSTSHRLSCAHDVGGFCLARLGYQDAEVTICICPPPTLLATLSMHAIVFVCCCSI